MNLEFNWQNLSPSLFLSFPSFNLSFILLCLFDFVTDIAAVTSNVKVADIAQVDTKTVIHWRLGIRRHRFDCYYCQCIYHCLSMVIMGKMAEYVVHPYNKINCWKESVNLRELTIWSWCISSFNKRQTVLTWLHKHNECDAVIEECLL